MESRHDASNPDSVSSSETKLSAALNCRLQVHAAWQRTKRSCVFRSALSLPRRAVRVRKGIVGAYFEVPSVG